MSTCGAWPSCGRGVVHQAQRHAPSSHANTGARSCGFARRAALGRAADRWPGGGKETSPGGAARCRRGAAPEKAARHAMATVKVSPRTALCYTLTSLQPAPRRSCAAGLSRKRVMSNQDTDSAVRVRGTAALATEEKPPTLQLNRYTGLFYDSYYRFYCIKIGAAYGSPTCAVWCRRRVAWRRQAACWRRWP